MADSSAIIAFFLREEGWNELPKYIATTISVDHAVKEFYNAVWKAANTKRISMEEAPRVLAKTTLRETCSLRARKNTWIKPWKTG
ncbi:MAG: hypothetical protein QXU11_10465 [Thermoproteota archaeon]